MNIQTLRKKIIVLVLAAALVFSLCACGSSASDAAAAAGDLDNYSPENPVTVKIGLTAAFYEDFWKPIQADLAKEGINIELVQFSDYVSPDEALENDELTLTAHQHHAYLKTICEEQGWTDLVSAGDTFIIALNLYSNQYKSVDEIKDGDRIAIPNDASNGGRALKLLADAGLITLSPDAGTNPEIKDIASYAKQIELVEMNASDIASALDDVAAAAVNGNYALEAGLTAGRDAITYEASDSEAARTYVNVVAVKEGNENNEGIQALVKVLKSDEIKQFIIDKYDGAVIPFEE